MPIYTPTPVSPSTIGVWDTSTVANGDDMSVPLKTLADSIAWLHNELGTIAARSEFPLAAIPYPTVGTPSNAITVTSATNAQGGAVSIASGTRLTLGAVVVPGQTGRQLLYQTPSYSSGALATNSTYYLRAQVVAGALLVYKQRGTDADEIPAGRVGVPDGASGGGFDSTVLDVLLARVITGAAGSLPTVTALVNSNRLVLGSSIAVAIIPRALSWTESDQYVEINWARAPRAAQPMLQAVAAVGSKPDGADLPAAATALSQSLQMIGFRKASRSDRYRLYFDYVYDDEVNDAGSAVVGWTAMA